MNLSAYNVLPIVLFSFLSLALTHHAQSGVTECAASPDPITVQEPDGSMIEIIGRGHINEHYTETTDGYTLLRNEDGFYEYAVLNEEGQLKPSGTRPMDAARQKKQAEEVLGGLKKHLRPEATAPPPEDHDSDIQDALPDDLKEDDVLEASFPSLGEHKLLVLLIEYPDLEAQYSKADFVDLLTQENYNGTGSFRDFYLENSDGQLDLNIDVEGWYMANNGYQYYGRQNGNGRTRELVGEALDAAEAEGVDFSQYDNTGDGEVDGILVVHSGPGAEEGAQTQYIWSHRSSLSRSNEERFYDNVLINDYGVQPETRGGGSRMVGIGIFAHEFGHVLGLPDLYDTDQNSAGIGEWGVMGSGSWLDQEHSPSHFSPWSKMRLDWHEAELLTERKELTIPPVSESNTFYKIQTEKEDEYFLIENRQRVNFDRALPGTGLAIWRINETVIQELRPSNSVNTDTSNFGVGLIQADNRRQLELGFGRGNAGDLYPGITENSEFSHSSSPRAVTSNGDYVGFLLAEIKEDDNTNDVHLIFDYSPIASFTTSRTSTCQGNPIDMINNSVHLHDFEWDFSDGNVSNVKNPSHAFDEPGTYTIYLRAYDAAGHLTEDSAIVEIEPAPKADFSYKLKDGTLKLENQSEYAGSFTWRFGEGSNASTSYSKEPEFRVEPGMAPNVRMIAAAGHGCRDTVNKTVYLRDFEDIANAYPNPFRNNLNLAISGQADEKVRIRILNYNGQEVRSFTSREWSANEVQTFEVDMTGLNPGFYIMEISNGSERTVKRIRKKE